MHYNYHTHTFRCRHASGTEREYIESALAAGIKKIGFSEHIPFCFPDGHESFYRLPTNEIDAYFQTLYALREEYRGKADILIGYEVEYYPRYFEQMYRIIKETGAEYIILGQHFIQNEEGDAPSCYTPSESADELIEYVDCVIAAMQTGLFTYVAHPDVFSFTGDNALYTHEIRRLCKAAKHLGVPFELNFLGIRQNRRYPNERFWQIVGEAAVPVTFGLDAHDVAAAGDVASLPRAMELVEKYHLNYIGEPNIIRI